MIKCNIIRCANLLLFVCLCLLILPIESANNPPKPLPNGKTRLPVAAVWAAGAYRYNAMSLGAVANMAFSLINLIFSLVNFYLIFGKYNAQLCQTAGKLKIAVEEMASRDMHPKIKMSLSRTIPDNQLLTEMMQLFKEPSSIFDGTNDLLEGQKAARLRRMATKSAPKAPSSAPKTTKSSKAPESKKETTTGSVAVSTVTETK